MDVLAPSFSASKEVYEQALVDGSEGDEEGLEKVKQIDQIKPLRKLVQDVNEFPVLFGDALQAQDVLHNAVAGGWEQRKRVGMPGYCRYPEKGKAVDWIQDAISPGRKGEESARRKMRDNCNGQAEGLTDLARMT